MKNAAVTIDQALRYDEIIDVRTPAEFEEDHIPGAINCPVLENEQRIEIGTLYKQVSPFEAKKLGAALISENIARHLRERFLGKPLNWRPLIYCWRGGNRSGSMTTVFRSIGWKAGQLEGGYKAYRADVLAQLETLPGRFRFHVLCGSTGSAKTRVLQAIGALSQQVLDLETLACHKGSVLGVLPDTRQPTQKWFETCLLEQLKHFDPGRPVYVEAESRKIGNLHLPEALIIAIRQGRCLTIDATLAARVDFLLRDYAYFPADPEWLKRRLNALHALVSNEILNRWLAYVDQGQWSSLVSELLQEHYDPLYHRSQNQNFSGFTDQPAFATDDLSETGIAALATRLSAA